MEEIAELLRTEVSANKEQKAGSPKKEDRDKEDPNKKDAKDKDKDSQRLLSPQRVLKTMAREYFTMLGTLSSSTRGHEVLAKFKIFTYLIELCEIQGRDDLSNPIMTSLDYNL